MRSQDNIVQDTKGLSEKYLFIEQQYLDLWKIHIQTLGQFWKPLYNSSTSTTWWPMMWQLPPITHK